MFNLKIHISVLLLFFISMKAVAQADSVKKDDPIEQWEVAAEFPGGEDELRKFIKKNMVYPVECYNNAIQGKIYVEFVIDTDGSVINPKVIRGIHPELDKEALRLVTIMPKWKPASQSGKPVKVKYRMPLQFKLM